jgi:hypothetical protein
MKHLLASLTVLVVSLAQLGTAADAVVNPVRLFNGKDLTNFYTYLNGHGKNNDPKKVFTVQEGMIRVSGEVFGYFVTEKEYENYHLVTEFKWGTATWPPRKRLAMDSGILLHCVGKDNVWMESIECQMIEGGTGDFILVGGQSQPTLSVHAEKRGGQSYYNPKAALVPFKGGRINWYARDPSWKDVQGFRGEKDVENPAGEWNRLECVCKGGDITNILNGKVVNAGTMASHTRGKILFQSEGAEVFFRRIDLLPLGDK